MGDVPQGTQGRELTIGSSANNIMETALMRRTLNAVLSLVLFLGLIVGQASAQEDLERRPGYQMPLAKAHPAWAFEQARPKDFPAQTGAIAFSPDGKYLAVTSFQALNVFKVIDEPNGKLYVFENYSAKDPADIKVHTVSDQLFHPLGAHWNEDGLFILERDEISKWTDGDGDGLPEKKKTFASGWISDNFHHFSFGLPYHDGYFYGTLSTTLHMSKEERETLKGQFIGGNAPNPEHRGCVMKVNAKTGEIQWIAGGLRTPNGPGIGPDGIVLAPDNQGDWKPANMIYVVKGGEFLGKYNSTASHINMPEGGVPSLFSEKEPTPPAIWLPQNEVGNSPSATLLIPEGLPFAGQVLCADITQGAVHRIYMEEVDGTWQGAAFRHTMGFDAGPNDLKVGPDGCLYVGCHGAGTGNWGWTNPETKEKTKYGLHRLRPTGKSVLEFEKIQATADGFRVSFTKPVPKDQLEDTGAWRVNAYTYIAKPGYGGPKIPNKYEDQIVALKSAKASADGKQVELILAKDRVPNHVYHIRIDAQTADGEKMWSPESWVTFHKAPAKADGVSAANR